MALLGMSTYSAAAPSDNDVNALDGVPIVEYEFDNSLTDSRNGSTLAAMPTCQNPLASDSNYTEVPCNSTATFGTDSIGSYWAWTSLSTSGGGLGLTTNTQLTNSYTIGLRFSFAETDFGYRKILDFENTANDNGLYFLDKELLFYLNTDLSNVAATTFEPDEVLDLIIIREEIDPPQSGMTANFIVYTITNSGLVKVMDVQTDDDSMPYDNGTGSVLGLFFDDYSTEDESVAGGKIYSLKVWDRALAESELAFAVGDSLDPSATTTTTTTTTVAESTTTTSTTTTTVAESTTTTVQTTTTVNESSTTMAPAADLPNTGSSRGLTVTVATLAVGCLLALVARRRYPMAH